MAQSLLLHGKEERNRRLSRQHAGAKLLRSAPEPSMNRYDAKEVVTLKHLMRLNLGLGLWLMISPFVLELVSRRALLAGWEDFLLGFGITIFTLCRVFSRSGVELWDFLIMMLGLTTLLNPIIYHYFTVKVVAWNNVVVGFMVLLLALYEARKHSA